MKRFLLLSGLAFLLSVHLAAAQSPAQQYVDQLQRSGVLKDAVWGVLAVDRNGQILAAHNQQQRMVPASNLKLVTTGTALHAFGPDFRFTTEVGYTGTVRDGVLEGDVYLIGHGDPTLGAKDSIATENRRLFWQWKSLLREAGIQRIQGRIVGDGTVYEGNLEHSSWEYNDIGTYYGTGMSALCFYQNCIDLEVQADVVGQPVRMRQSYPETPWMHLSNQSITGPDGTGNSLYLYTTDLAPYAELRGSFATDRRPKTEHFANKFGALTCAYYFWKNLCETGWTVDGGYADVDRNGYVRGPDFVPAGKAATPTVLGRTLSAPLRDIARITNVRSDNFYAESLLRAMGEQASESALYDSCLVARRQVLEELVPDPDGLRQADGCGLSRMNYVSPEWMVRFLQGMQQSPAFEAFLASIPHPGEGTLTTLLPQAEGRERIRVKSGSMDGVLCYSGYILGPDGQPAVTLSILTNNTTAPVSEVRAALARFLKLLLDGTN